MATTHFIEPVDILFLRGNRLFGDAGSFGESLTPPWPSVVAGALRSGLSPTAAMTRRASPAGRWMTPSSVRRRARARSRYTGFRWRFAARMEP